MFNRPTINISGTCKIKHKVRTIIEIPKFQIAETFLKF